MKLRRYVYNMMILKVSAEVLEAIKTQSFRNIFLMYFFASFFEVTLGLNYKSYGLSKINND